MDEAEALRILDERARFGQHLGLDVVRGMLATLDDFHRDLRVVHVAGTNGKGSVSALVSAALHACGHRVGLYTSPHLVRFHERIRVGERDIGGDELAAAMTRIRPALDAFPQATYFEVATVLALRHFVDVGVDVAVLEVGLGGRLDATNVFERPLVTVITNISLEHTEVLGKTEPEVAREKGGIIKPEVPLVVGATGEALATLRDIARERGAPIVTLGDDFIPLAGDELPDGAGQTLDVQGLTRDWGEVRIPLMGAHQQENAALALAALDIVDAAGVRAPVADARAGLMRARWPGRLQRIPGRPTLLLDGAHNAAGMRALAAHLAAHKLRPVVVFGALADKAWMEMVEALAPHVRDAIVTRVPSERALEPQEAARAFSMMGLFGVVVDDPGHAVRTAENVAGPDGIVLVTGSLYLVGDVLGRVDGRHSS